MDDCDIRYPKRSLFSDQRSKASTTSSQRSQRRRLAQEAAIVRTRNEVEIERRKLEISRARKKKELEIKQLELEEEAKLEQLILKTKFEHEVREIEKKFQEDNSAKSQSTLKSIRSFSFHENRERLDDWIDQLSHGENPSETKFSIKSEGDQMTPMNVNRAAPKVIIENKSEADGLVLKFNPGIAKKKTDKQQCFVVQEYKNSKMQLAPQEGLVPQHQVISISVIKLSKLGLSSFSGDPLEWPE